MKSFLACGLLLCALGISAEQVEVPATALPPIQYRGNVAGDELYSLIKADARFAKLGKEIYGCPIVLHVWHTFEMTGGGKASTLASAIFAGGTLGLLPVVTNGDSSIYYEIAVNGSPLAIYSYKKNFTRSQNIYTNDTTYGMGKEGLEWAKGTVSQFLADSAKDERLAALIREYEFYFSPSAVAADAAGH